MLRKYYVFIERLLQNRLAAPCFDDDYLRTPSKKCESCEAEHLEAHVRKIMLPLDVSTTTTYEHRAKTHIARIRTHRNAFGSTGVERERI